MFKNYLTITNISALLLKTSSWLPDSMLCVERKRGDKLNVPAYMAEPVGSHWSRQLRPTPLGFSPKTEFQS